MKNDDCSSPAFRQAHPIWLSGRQTQVNITAGFTCSFSGRSPAELRLTAASIYRVFLNGTFLFHGPARSALGDHRVDVLPLPAALLGQENVVAIEVVNFYVNNFYVPKQPAFLCAEVCRGDQVLCATGRAAGALYGDERLLEKGRRLCQTIRAFSFDGEWFRDQALRRDGVLIPGGEATEVCQYYAFFFRVADRARHPQLYHRLLDEFSPASRAAGAHPQITPANAFIGNYLRLELLSQAGRSRQIMEEIKTFFAPMAALTGTLWEHMGPCASCDHGFASHAACSLIRDVLGLRRTGANSLLLHIPDLPLEHCRVVLPLPEGPLEVAGRRSGSAVSPRICLPRGYTIQIAADPCLTVVRKELLPC